MATLTSLPRELRQKILLLAIQQETQLIGTAWPSTITSLLRVCKTLRRDMPWAITAWSPATRHLLTPSDPTTTPPTISIDGVLCTPDPAPTLTVSIFHAASPSTIRNADRAHPDLLAPWLAAVPHLPLPDHLSTLSSESDIPTTIALDITPAPGWMRSAPRHAHALHALLLDRRAAQGFMDGQVRGVAELVGQVRARCGERVRVELTGTLAVASGGFVGEVGRACHGVRYVGGWIDGGSVAGAGGGAGGGLEAIKRVVHGLAPKKGRGTAAAADVGRAVELAPLRKVRWSGRSGKLFGKACGEAGVEAVGEDLRVLAELMVDGRRSRLEMPPAGNVHRAMVHSLAHDMGLRTASEGDGEGRYVVVSKKDVGDYGSTAVAA